MIREEAGRLLVAAPMTIANARQLLAAGNEHIARADVRFDLSGVKEVDSAGLAVVFAWRRSATRLGKKLDIVNPPANLQSLAQVYGVGDLLA